jgi:hypothetical protein
MRARLEVSMAYRLDIPGNEDINITIDFGRKLWRTSHPGWCRIAKQWGGAIDIQIVQREENITIDVNGIPETIKQPYGTSAIYCFNGTVTQADANFLNTRFGNRPGFRTITPHPSRIERRLAAFVLHHLNSFSGYFRFLSRPFNEIDLNISTSGKWKIV